jgi:hypothetical protein
MWMGGWFGFPPTPIGWYICLFYLSVPSKRLELRSHAASQVFSSNLAWGVSVRAIRGLGLHCGGCGTVGVGPSINGSCAEQRFDNCF